MTDREPSIAFGDSWWSTIAVVPCSSASRAARLADQADHLEVEDAVEPPPDVLEDLAERGRRPAGRWHATRERRVDVVVGADEPGGHRGVRAAVLGIADPGTDARPGHRGTAPAGSRARTVPVARAIPARRGTAARAAAESRMGRVVRRMPSKR